MQARKEVVYLLFSKGKQNNEGKKRKPRYINQTKNNSKKDQEVAIRRAMKSLSITFLFSCIPHKEPQMKKPSFLAMMLMILQPPKRRNENVFYSEQGR